MLRAAVIALLALLAAAVPAAAQSTTTVQRTIQDCNDDRVLDEAPGEPHTGGASGSGGGNSGDCETDREGREPLRLPPERSLLNFLQLTDFQMVDEESPGRVEFLDGTQRVPSFNPFAAAYRPQESLTTQITEASVRQARNLRSPVTGAGLDFSLLTGDNADSQQFNETRWFIDILDGTTGTGNPDPEMHVQPGADRKIDPDSGIPTPGCEATPGSVYDGVRDGGSTATLDQGYYEPDRSSEPREDGDGYSPLRADNEREVGQPVSVRDFPGLFERANEPFEAVGLDMPWYSAFGNHDALVQGNSSEGYFGPGGVFDPQDLVAPATERFNPSFHAIVTGCVKVQQPTTAQTTAITDLQQQIDGGSLDPAQVAEAQGQMQDIAFEALRQARQDPEGFVAAGGTLVGTSTDGSLPTVPRDPRRCHLPKDDPAAYPPDSPCATGSWIGQHFRTTGTPVGHGFAPSVAADCARYGDQAVACRDAAARNSSDPDAAVGRPREAVDNHDGYYSFVPKPGFRFVAIDTVTDECGAPICSEGSVDHTQFEWLEDQLEVATLRRERVIVFSHHTLRTTRQPNADVTEEPVHYGQRVDRDNPLNVQNPSGERTLEELFCLYPAVIAHVTGHEHENFVRRHRCEDDRPPTPGTGDFHEISTAAHIDFPQQSRMIEVVDRGGGSLAFVLTIVDHESPANPGGRPEALEQGAAPSDIPRLASIGREIAYNDYQLSRNGAARGGRDDRNVVLDIAPR